MTTIFAIILIMFLPFTRKALELKDVPMKGMLQFPSMCSAYKFIEKHLTQGGEKLTLVLITHTEDAIEIWTGIKKETWTVISRSAKLSIGCVLAVGTGVFHGINKGI